MSIGPVIEVLVGLIFMFFVFSVLASGVNEFISHRLHKRVNFLAAGIWQLLDNRPANKSSENDTANKYVEKFWSHPLVTQLGQSMEREGKDRERAAKRQKKNGLVRRIWAGLGALAAQKLSSETDKAARLKRKAAEVAMAKSGNRRLPSYIPTPTFVAVLLDITKTDAPGADTPLQRSLEALHDDKDEMLRKNLGRWFDDQMDRVSGWYKRESKTILFILGLIIVAAMNVDTIAVARTLWKDPTTRSIVNNAAQAQIDAAKTTSTTVAGGTAPATLLEVVCKKPATTSGTTATTTEQDALRGTYDCATQFPIGWHISQDCYPNWTSRLQPCDGIGDHVKHLLLTIWRRPMGVVLKLVGLLITAGALSFGAPFWFDLLNRFANLRGAGAKPPTTADKGSPTK